MSIDIALTAPQREFVFSNSAHPAIVGGLGSGKTRAGTFRAVILLLEERGLSVVYGLPTYDLISLRAMPGVEEDLNMLGVEYTVNKSSYTITVKGYGDIIFRSYDNPNRWVAFECAHGILDELDLSQKDKAEVVWRKATERIRQKCKRGNTLGVVCTPDGGVNGFVHEKWVKKAQVGYELIKASTRSNPYLPDGYVEQILANYDPILANLYIDGEFVSLNQNKVYHFFNRSTHYSPRTIQPNDWLHIGIDFNIGGCVAVVFVIENNNPIVVDEFVSHDTRDFCNNLIRFKSHQLTIYPDASGAANRTNASQSDISIIRGEGHHVMVNSTNPAIRDRINAVNGLLAHNRLLVNSDKCPNVANMLETQGYGKDGNPEKFDTHPAIDDYADSLGYGIAFRYPVGRVTLKTTVGGMI